MAMIVLFAIGMVIGLPVIAIVALVRSGTAERRTEESWDRISNLEGEIAGLRRELAKLSDRVPEVGTTTVADPAAHQEVNREPEPLVVAIAPAAAEEVKAAPPRKSLFQRLKTNLPLEQLLGMNLFAKIGITLLVLGLALLGRIALIAMGPGLRVGLIYTIAAALLGGGIWLERRERYRLLGRTGIGGGWALLFFATYALHHVAPMMVLRSNTLDCLLMLIVAIAMVVHTLRYRSQLVTGLAFLLAFSTVALSQDTVYALVAGVILALGIAAIALRMSWFELEIFGILATYANHFYWLYKLYPGGFTGKAFPEFWPSAIILVLYWATFRISYVARKVTSPRQESLSTIAAIANTVLLLAVMKFQSTHPELAFYALLGIGALEFIFGQLPVTRRRQAAFTLLTVVGTLLIFAAVPFRFSGNNIALFWMIAAEALLIAGLVQRESLFQRLGLLAGCVTGLLILYEARSGFSAALQRKDGILLLTCSALFYLNVLYLRERWKELFDELDKCSLSRNKFVISTGETMGFRPTQSDEKRDPSLYGHPQNCHPDWSEAEWRDLLFREPVVEMSSTERNKFVISTGAKRSGEICGFSSILATAQGHLGCLTAFLGVWALLTADWTAIGWAAMLLGAAFGARRLKNRSLLQQAWALAGAVILRAAVFNAHFENPFPHHMPVRILTLALLALMFYCTRWILDDETASSRLLRSVSLWAGAALLATLAAVELPNAWIAVIWILFALALAIVDRVFSVEELPWQAHIFVLLAISRAATLNLFITGKLHGVDLRLITVSILVAAVYSLARWVRMPKNTEARHAYTWVGSGFAAWLLWCELQPITVAPALGVFALLLFEIGVWRGHKQLRLQAYALLAASFLRIFLVNFSAATLPGEFISPRIYTVVPLTLIYFYVWARLVPPKTHPEFGRWSASNLIACFGTGSIVALLYYQLAPQWIIAGWALVVVALMVATLAFDKEVFLDQTALLTAGIVVRGLAHNVFGSSYFISGGWRGKFSVLSLTSALLLAALPIAFRIRRRYQDRPRGSSLARFLGARRPDQILFFAPLLLIAITIAVKMDPGTVTLAWGIVGLAVILLGLLATERSYRLTGLTLLVLCIGKIVFRDAWHLDERSRYITFIVVGAALILVSALYSKYRDQVSRLL
jgi:uncharacterized membrane protein